MSAPTDQAEVGGTTRRDPDATRQRVLDVTIELLEAAGEGQVRIADVSARADVSVGAIYHHFRDREHLVASARAEQFRRRATLDVAAFEHATSGIADLDQHLATVAAVLRGMADADRRTVRWDRLSALAATRYDPEVATEVGEVQHQLTAALTGWIQRSQSRGWLASDLDAATLAVLLQAALVGMVVVDVDEARPVTHEAVVELILRMLGTLVARTS